MTAIRSEKIDDAIDTPTQLSPGPTATEDARLVDVEAEIRDFVRNDVAYLRRGPNMPAPNETAAEATVTKVNFLIQRVAGASLNEIANLMDELEELRELLHFEGQRVQRELTGYAQLSQTAMKSTRMIAENMAQWKNALDPALRGPTPPDRA